MYDSPLNRSSSSLSNQTVTITLNNASRTVIPDQHSVSSGLYNHRNSTGSINSINKFNYISSNASIGSSSTISAVKNWRAIREKGQNVLSVRNLTSGDLYKELKTNIKYSSSSDKVDNKSLSTTGNKRYIPYDELGRPILEEDEMGSSGDENSMFRSVSTKGEKGVEKGVRGLPSRRTSRRNSSSSSNNRNNHSFSSAQSVGSTITAGTVTDSIVQQIVDMQIQLASRKEKLREKTLALEQNTNKQVDNDDDDEEEESVAVYSIGNTTLTNGGASELTDLLSTLQHDSSPYGNMMTCVNSISNIFMLLSPFSMGANTNTTTPSENSRNRNANNHHSTSRRSLSSTGTREDFENYNRKKYKSNRNITTRLTPTNSATGSK